jgi:hypothetical protein
MTDIKHTPEPLTIEEYYQDSRQTGGGITWFLIRRAGRTIAQATSLEEATRLIACVNACAGIPTEKLEANTMVEVGALQELLKQGHKRLAAAVNACAGIPMEALEAGVVGELMEGLSILAYEAERRAGVPGKYVANARELLTQAGYYEQCRKILTKAKGDAHATV